MSFKSLPESTEKIAEEVVDAAFKVHKKLGPGLLESIYETCLSYEMTEKGLTCKQQVTVPVVYDDLTFESGLRLDLLIEDEVIVELKAVDKFNPVWEAQLLSYLKMTENRLGFLINFNVSLIKDGIKRIIV